MFVESGSAVVLGGSGVDESAAGFSGVTRIIKVSNDFRSVASNQIRLIILSALKITKQFRKSTKA